MNRIALVIMLLAACSKPKVATTADAEPHQPGLDGVPSRAPPPGPPRTESGELDEVVRRAKPTDDLVEGLPYYGLKPIESVRKIGRVVKETAIQRPNPHVPGDQTEHRTFEFEGLKLEGFVKSGVGEFVTCQAIVTGPNWKMAGLGVGGELSAVEAALGPPGAAEGDVITFGGFRTQAQLDFKVKDGRIREVRVIFGCD